MGFLQVFVAILGEAEQIVPVFIHNPQSQKIEAVVVTSINALFQSLLNKTTPAAASAAPVASGNVAPTSPPPA